MPDSPRDMLEPCNRYLAARTAAYADRLPRYMAAAGVLAKGGLTDSMTVCDVGAGWTEFDICLRAILRWKGRYWPVDGGLDGTDLELWVPPQHADWFIALEVLEHLANPDRLLAAMMGAARKGVVISTPNPRTVDVLGMDADHRTIIYATYLEHLGFTVTAQSFYGKPKDSLFAYIVRPY